MIFPTIVKKARDVLRSLELDYNSKKQKEVLNLLYKEISDTLGEESEEKDQKLKVLRELISDVRKNPNWEQKFNS